MFCGKGGSNLIDKCHYRALCALKIDRSNQYEALLADCSMHNIHSRNLKLLVTEIYKSIHGIGPRIMHDIYKTKQSVYKLRSGHLLALPLYKKYDTAFGVNTFDFRAISTWNKLPSTIKTISSLKSFKNALQNISPICTCKICN